MAVRIRMKRLGRRNREFYRICAMDARAPRDGRVIEELGFYDPMVPETDARTQLNGERIDYWLSVGAQPTEKVAVLIRKYGSGGSHLDAQREALERVKAGGARRRAAALQAAQSQQPTKPAGKGKKGAAAEEPPPQAELPAAESVADSPAAAELAEQAPPSEAQPQTPTEQPTEPQGEATEE